MDKLEQYLDQVCRSIGGPIEMRRHVRQELREHLLDAIAQHKAAGMSEGEAVDKALEEFGKPDEVRADLEAAHGQRMTWILDKAMQWKEMTMKAKWLWMTWAYLSILVVIALEVMTIAFHVVLIFPKYQKLLHDGYIDQWILEDQETWWMNNFLHNLSFICGHYTTWIAFGTAAAVAIFEWRVRGENKPFIRMSALGTVAAALMLIVGLMAACYVILFCMGIPAMGSMARPWSIERVTTIETAIAGLEKAHAEKDWPEMQKKANEASGQTRLLLAGPAVSSLALHNEPRNTPELRGQVRGMHSKLAEAEQAIRDHDAAKLESALQDFRKAFEPVRESARRPAP